MTTCSHKPIDFSDLENWDDAKTSSEPATVEDSVKQWTRDSRAPASLSDEVKGVVYEENCPDCRGSGRFYSYAGRYVGPCFKCKGKGKLKFKTSPESRAAAREYAAKKRDEKAARELERRKEWADAHEAEIAFLKDNASWSSFYGSLWSSLTQYGSLTDAQLAAVRKGIEKKKARDAERAAARAAVPVADRIDLSELPAGYYAVPGGDTRLKVRISKPDGRSTWAGWIFVDDGAEYGRKQKYGRQRPGGFYEGMICAELKTILADPKAAMAAYGHLVGRCGRCGRMLEDEASVARGIGPICADKLGW